MWEPLFDHILGSPKAQSELVWMRTASGSLMLLPEQSTTRFKIIDVQQFCVWTISFDRLLSKNPCCEILVWFSEADFEWSRMSDRTRSESEKDHGNIGKFPTSKSPAYFPVSMHPANSPLYRLNVVLLAFACFFLQKVASYLFLQVIFNFKITSLQHLRLSMHAMVLSRLSIV